MNEIYKKIRNNPNFLNLVRLRNRISWALTIIIISCYFTFITIIAFAPNIFSQKLFSYLFHNYQAINLNHVQSDVNIAEKYC